jgi:CDP-glycerol glycerophosphotransferase (TagB/SpsB family)
MYEAFGINPKNIQVLGSIEQDTLFELNSTYVTDSEPIANFQVNSILFFLPPLFGGEPSEDAVSELFELFSELEEQGHYQIGVKPHPLDTKRGRTHEIEELCRFSSVKVLDSKGYVSPHDLAQLINSYDLCVHGVSSVQFSLFAMEKPTLVYLSEKSPYYHSSYEPFYNQFARFSNSTSSFLQHLKSIRENPKPFLKEVQEKSGAYKSDYMLFDGKSTERYVTACENLMAESQDKRTKVV